MFQAPVFMQTVAYDRWDCWELFMVSLCCTSQPLACFAFWFASQEELCLERPKSTTPIRRGISRDTHDRPLFCVLKASRSSRPGIDQSRNGSTHCAVLGLTSSANSGAKQGAVNHLLRNPQPHLPHRLGYSESSLRAQGPGRVPAKRSWPCHFSPS
jgi:hypothetical protein